MAARTGGTRSKPSSPGADIVLPLTLAPGQTVHGSLFFRVTPGPQRLALRGQAGDEPHESIIDLAPLAGLHRKAPAPTAPATVAPTTSRSVFSATSSP